MLSEEYQHTILVVRRRKTEMRTTLLRLNSFGPPNTSTMELSLEFDHMCRKRPERLAVARDDGKGETGGPKAR